MNGLLDFYICITMSQIRGMSFQKTSYLSLVIVVNDSFQMSGSAALRDFFYFANKSLEKLPKAARLIEVEERAAHE